MTVSLVEHKKSIATDRDRAARDILQDVLDAKLPLDSVAVAAVQGNDYVTTVFSAGKNIFALLGAVEVLKRRVGENVDDD